MPLRNTLALLMLVLVLAAPGALRAEALSRREVVARALAQNPAVLRSRDDLQVFEGRKKEAMADALPELKLYGVATRYRDPSFLNSSSFDSLPAEFVGALRPIPANLFDGYADVRQTLFSFKLGAVMRGAREAAKLAQEDVRRTEQAVALEAVRAYNGYLLALEHVRVAERALRQKERHLELARNRRAAGVATELEVLRSEVDLANGRTQVARVRGESRLALGALNGVMLRPVDAPIEATDSLALVPYEANLDEVVREALESRPEARGIALSERIADELIRVARSEGLPRLDLHGNWGFSVRRPENFFDSNYQKWSASITLTVPVFDGRRTAGKLMQARAEREKVVHDRASLENRIRLEAKDAYERLDVAQSVLDAAELNVTQAQRALEMTENNYRFGAATTLDVLDAQAALTLAESLRAEALHEHANARATLRYVMARDPLDPPAAEPAAVPSGETR